MKWRLVGAVGAGLVQFLAFPPIGWWWTAPLGVAALLVALRGTSGGRAALLGLVCGWAFFLPLLHWLSVLGPDAWLALALVIAGWYAAMGWGFSVVGQTRWWVVAVPAVWVLQEWARSRFPWGGLGWGRLAFGQPDSPFTGWVTLGGASLLSFVVALAGALIVVIISGGGKALAAGAGLLALAVVGLGFSESTTVVDEPKSSRLAVIQGNVPQPGIDFLGRPVAVLGNHERATVELAAAVATGTEEQPDAVIWPENAADVDPVLNDRARALVDSAADAIGVPILVGTVQAVPGQPDRVANVGLVWDPQTGPGAAYVKQRPVPFGEFLPLRPLLTRFISRFDRVPRDFVAGQASGVLELGPVTIADVICFEVSNDEIVRTAVREGGRVVVVQTNNATYATTAQPEQQYDISRLRARETGRSVLVAATTGITAVITPEGRATTLPQLQSGWINQSVDLRDSWTPAIAYGGWVEGGLAWVGGLAILLGLWVRRRRRSEG